MIDPVIDRLIPLSLGDPGCTWSVGGPAPTGSAKSHPGVCEPVDSAKCKSQTWISCSGMKANCSGRTEPGVKTHTIRFPKWNVSKFAIFSNTSTGVSQKIYLLFDKS